MKIGGNTVELELKYQVYFSLLSGLIYGLVHCFFRIASGEPIHFFQVIFQVVFFTGFWYFIFFRLIRKKQEIAADSVDESSLSFYGAAHQMIKTSAVVGMLYGTEKQLIFEPNTKEFISSNWTLDWKNIEDVEIYKFLGLFNHGILIQTQGKMRHKLIVNQPQLWLEAIQAKIES
ncbi:hypothetical protein [Myroides fluvii]|uniref:hypothetical protein n=1 Tax=Myroides fluvii TaxID=2572594 RepID=UPI00131D5283|nr:hypothetical protein [Myroides fluvii]